MAFSSWRGTMGLIKPTHRPGSLEETIRLLPEGIGVVPVTVGFTEGSKKEFRDSLNLIEDKVRELAEIGVDLIAPGGAPPLMVHGYRGEHDIIERWEREYGLPVITAGGTQVDALRALGAKRIVGITYFSGDINDLFAGYFSDAGFDVLAMAGMDVPFTEVQTLAVHQVYRHAKATFLANPGADLIYLLGSGWRVLDVIELLEQDLGVPVLHAVPARVWSTQQHFHVGERRSGYGRLLAELPSPVAGPAV
jgi:maleate isomerase